MKKIQIIGIMILMLGCSSEEKIDLVFGDFENKTVDYRNLNNDFSDGDPTITPCSFPNAQFFLIIKNISLMEEFYHCQSESDYTESVFRYKAQVEQFLVGVKGYEEKEIVVNDFVGEPLYIENEEVMFLVGLYQTKRGEYFIMNRLKIMYSDSALDSASSPGFTSYRNTLPPDLRSLSNILGQTLSDRNRICANVHYNYHNQATNIEDAIYESDRAVPVPCN